jgi:predicted nucleotidyltransferase
MSRNLFLLETAAVRLGDLLSEVVFVGGSTLDLMVSDEGAAPVRPTTDVDVVVEITTYHEYVAFAERLRAIGFSEDMREKAPLCRWRHGDLTLDVMPLDASTLGFTNRWYQGVFDTAAPAKLQSGIEIRLVTAPFFLGTKLEAFRARGQGDFYGSHDIEDVVAVIDGRESLLSEIHSAPADLIAYLAEATTGLLATPAFMESISGHLPNDGVGRLREGLVIERITAISELSNIS